MKELTGKQKRFVEEYMIDFNATQAYKRAGYSATTDIVARANASKLLTNYNIQSYLKKKQAEAEKASSISHQWVLDELKKMYEDTKDRAPAVANKSLELIGKHIGMFTEKVEHSGKITEEVIDMTPEQRTQKLKELLSKVVKDKDILDKIIGTEKKHDKS